MADLDLQIRQAPVSKKKFGPSVWSKNMGGSGGGGGGRGSLLLEFIHSSGWGGGTHGLHVNESSARLSVARYHILLSK